MNVLFVSTPGAGHLRPLLPLVEAFVAGGDDVAVACDSDAASTVEQAGARWWLAGEGEGAWFERLAARTKGAPGDGLPAARIHHYFIPRLFGEIAADSMVDDVLACARDLHPDLLVFETYAFAAPLVAALLGIPAVHHLIGPMLEPDVLALTNDAVSPLWRAFGRDVPGHAGVFEGSTIEICPPSLEPGPPPGGASLRLRPCPLPEVPPATPSRPLVYLTMGTSFNANLDAFVPVLEALADEPLDLVVTVGSDQDPASLGEWPANVRIERFIPQGALLPGCTAVVHHGGAGTTFGSLAHGLPQVVIPQGADNFLNAAMLERAGVATTLGPGQVTPTTVRAAVRRVLDEPGFAAAARRVSAEIEAMPGAAEVADQLRVRIGG